LPIRKDIKSMKIKLIAPARKPEWGESFWDLKTLCKLTGRKAGGAPLALPTLAALTPSDVEVVLTDENVEPINFEENVDFVGITGMTCVIPRSYEIADEFRKRGVPVVMGGIHVSMIPEEAIQHCDCVVIGEAEEIWEQLVRDTQKNNLQKFYQAPRFPDLTNAPMPRWDLLKNDKYCYFTIQTGRGCPYDCEFCSVQTFNGRQYRYKSIDCVLKEITFLKGLETKKPFFFVDDNILAVKDYAKELFNKLVFLNIKWWCQSSVDGLKDNEILDLMYKSGCREIFVGFESILQSSLNSLHKSKINMVDEYKDIINTVHSHGIAIFGSFILGSDNDNPDIFEHTGKFINDTNISFAMINILTPPPGTKLYSRLKAENRLITYEWHKYDGEHTSFKPNLMSQIQLQKKRLVLLKNIYSYRCLYNRLKNIWDIGVFVRDKKNRKLFTKGRLLFTLRTIFDNKFNRKFFILKSLWNKNITSIMSVLLAINFREYAYQNRLNDNVPI